MIAFRCNEVERSLFEQSGWIHIGMDLGLSSHVEDTKDDVHVLGEHCVNFPIVGLRSLCKYLCSSLLFDRVNLLGRAGSGSYGSLHTLDRRWT